MFKTFSISTLKTFLVGASPSPKRIFVLVGGLATLLYLFLVVHQLDEVQVKPKNYFEDAGRLKYVPLLINTSACKIPDLDPWDPEVAGYYGPPHFETKCDEKLPKWTSIDHTRSQLVFNEDLMSHSLEELECCYMTVSRTSDPKLQPEFDLDYSPCVDITTPRTDISSEFIVVECTLGNKPLYRNFHALVPPDTVGPRLESRKHRPNLDNMEVLPPNIIVLGIDSTSRLNFLRYMSQTIEVLESLGAKEMLGFTKVGESTYPNMISALMGYHSEEQVPDLCFKKHTSFHDDCPFIWRHLEDAGYLTGHLEDGNTFTYLRQGFKQMPVDFYLRPLFKAAFNYEPNLGPRVTGGNMMESCIGYQTNNEVMLDYVEATLDYAGEVKRPIFNYAWSTELTHEHASGLSNLDGVYSSYLERLESKGHLDNTILLVMGDHGYRHGDVRQTMVGLFEVKLPVLWIYLPPRIRKARPDWESALTFNGGQLTSPYAVYWSTHLILKTFGPEGSYRPPEDVKSLSTGKVVKRHPNHQTFFEPASPNSSCSDLGIPSEYCACGQPRSLAPEDVPLAKEAAQVAVENINRVRIDPNKCAPLSLTSVQGAATRKSKAEEKQFIVTFETTPGGALFEAEVTYGTNSKEFESFRNVSVSRINKMTMGDVTCIADHIMELYCYCK